MLIKSRARGASDLSPRTYNWATNCDLLLNNSRNRAVHFDSNTLKMDKSVVDSFRFSQSSAVVRRNPANYFGCNKCIYATCNVGQNDTETKKKQKKKTKKNDVTQSNSQETANVCLCWGFTAQSTQWGHVERGQFT